MLFYLHLVITESTSGRKDSIYFLLKKIKTRLTAFLFLRTFFVSKNQEILILDDFVDSNKSGVIQQMSIFCFYHFYDQKNG